ncbi:MAG: protein translocase subunit SecD [Patescibacteria group bacterium]
MRRNPQVIFGLVLVVTALAVVFTYPGRISETYRPWHLGLDLVGGSHLVYEVDLSKVEKADQESVLNGLRDVIEKRVNTFGVSEPQIFVTETAGKAGLVVELAGISDVGQAIKLIGETPSLDFREVAESGSSTIFLPTNVTGRYITKAQLNFDSTTHFPEISFSLNNEGAQLFQQLTKKNIGKPICIFMDNQPIIPDSAQDSCPRVQAEISGGQARITGQFTLARAKEIVGRFNAGALPAPITLVNQDTISATLGADLLRKAIVAGAAGTLIVMAFMIIFYGTAGLVAALALLVYIPITLAIFKLVPVTLTLAGLAGFILTIGMAVDANILIFERMKEESAKGLSRQASIDEGFRRAWSSIRDSNISTSITALILYVFTTGFIRGFALTLFLGVMMSMFSALLVTWAFLKIFHKAK